MKVMCCTLVGNEIIDLAEQNLSPEHQTLDQAVFSMQMGRWFKTTRGVYLNPDGVVKISEVKEP